MKIVSPLHRVTRVRVHGKPFSKNDSRISKHGRPKGRFSHGRALTLYEYQQRAHETAIYPRDKIWHGVVYTALKQCGEAGEFAEHVGKAIRDDGHITQERCSAMLKELGDVLWYVAENATNLGVSLDDVAHQNLAKLRDRQERGVLKGSGDNR